MTTTITTNQPLMPGKTRDANQRAKNPSRRLPSMLTPPDKEFSFFIDRNLRITSWNDGITELTGISSRRAVGKKYFDVIPKITIGGQDALSRALKNKKAVTLRGCRFQCLYAHVNAVVSIRPVHQKNGAPGQAKVILRPMASCSMTKKLDHLQKFIAIGKTASTLAHGVRNPLNALKGAVVYLRDRYAGEEPLNEFMHIMESEITRLDIFISQFLSSTASVEDRVSVNINNLIDRIKIFVSLQTYAHNINCEYTLGDVPPLIANPFHLEQALLNVINNAIDAMKAGGTLGIRTHAEKSSDGQMIVIEISDTGPGMTVENYENAGSDHTAGRGFGLFIAYEMLKYYNGRLEIHGEKGRGTTARFLLPCPGEIVG